MKVVLDSFDLLRAIGANPEIFEGIGDPVRKQANALLIAQLKHKALSLSRFREVRNAIGAEALALFMDTADDTLLKAVVKKLDPHCSIAKAGRADELRPHLLHLAEGNEPSAKPAKPVRQPKGAAKEAHAGQAGGATGPHAITTKPPGRR